LKRQIKKIFSKAQFKYLNGHQIALNVANA